MDVIQQIKTATRPLVMGIVNVTPDSFSDGGQYNQIDQTIRHAELLVAEGADILDIGGESTRPGAVDVSVQQELDRVIPVIEQLKQFNIPISIDTSKAEVMMAAVDAGSNLINDVYGFRREGSVEAAAKLGVPLCIMHMLGEPRTMQKQPHYDNVISDVMRFFQQQIKTLIQAGVSDQNIIIDPGFGFGKNLMHNCQLLNELREFEVMGYPVLVGVSRKSMIGELTGKTVEQRMPGSIAAAIIAAQQGARIIRVHDVAATVDAMNVISAVSKKKENKSLY
jgi:dihydropteroate synthase